MRTLDPATLLARLPRRKAELRGRLYARLLPGSVGGGCRIGAGVFLDGMDQVRLADRVILGDGVTIAARAPGRVEIGTKSFLNAGCHVSSTDGGVVLGDDVLVGPNVVVVDQDHAFHDASRPIARQGMSGGGPVLIGAGSWLAAGAVVLGPTTLAPGSVVGANAVVRGHFPRRCVVVGAPGRVVRYLDEPDGKVRG